MARRIAALPRNVWRTSQYSDGRGSARNAASPSVSLRCCSVLVRWCLFDISAALSYVYGADGLAWEYGGTIVHCVCAGGLEWGGRRIRYDTIQYSTIQHMLIYTDMVCCAPTVR